MTRRPRADEGVDLAPYIDHWVTAAILRTSALGVQRLPWAHPLQIKAATFYWAPRKVLPDKGLSFQTSNRIAMD